MTYGKKEPESMLLQPACAAIGLRVCCARGDNKKLEYCLQSLEEPDPFGSRQALPADVHNIHEWMSGDPLVKAWHGVKPSSVISKTEARG